jgi:hypothetical protein
MSVAARSSASSWLNGAMWTPLCARVCAGRMTRRIAAGSGGGVRRRPRAQPVVTLGLVCQLLADAANLGGVLGWLGRIGVPAAAILMSGGFFAASAGRGATGPNRFMAILWLGATSLTIGVIALGVGLLTA